MRCRTATRTFAHKYFLRFSEMRIFHGRWIFGTTSNRLPFYQQPTLTITQFVDTADQCDKWRSELSTQPQKLPQLQRRVTIITIIQLLTKKHSNIIRFHSEEIIILCFCVFAECCTVATIKVNNYIIH